MLKLQEAIDHLKTNVYGTDADDTIALGIMLAQINEQLRVSNLLKMKELGLISIDELGDVVLDLRQAVGLDPSTLKLDE